ncbi:hypothetical protein cypCar_00007702 [Cyprinus carpio]|nr:hypothetical protein cypCar_00007702 [Cyprinus carpio]
MSLKKRKPSMVFSWHKSFTILAPWRKGKRDIVLDNEVVLTKMKHLNNFPEKLLNVEDSISTISISMSEQDNTEPLQADEVNRANQSNPLGSGLGYLEHICQLIEKIGQLQEHNLRLQKQICGLQKEGRRVISKLALSVQALGPEKSSTVTLSENYTWGRVKELVKKTKLRNQSRLGLSSGSLKRSCPQLYRPDVMSAERPRTNRNSMIALGHQKLDYLWPQ